MTDESEKQNQQELTYWFIDRGQISNALVSMAYEGMDTEKARQVRDELSEAIERVENAE